VKRLLLVSYFYPPLGGSGVFRPLRFSKYLPRHGWDVSVLTVSPRVRLPHDRSLAGDIPAGLRVEATPTLEPRNPFLLLNRLGLQHWSRALERLCMLPDSQRGWVPFAVSRGARLLRQQRHHAILTTSSPLSAHLVGRALQRRSGVPWIADFRDEWTTNPYLRPLYPSPWHLRRNQQLERSVLREARGVISVSEPWLEAHRGLVPAEPPGKFHVLCNGYDAEHFATPAPEPARRFRIVYAGTFYGHRSPRIFLAGLRRAFERGLLPFEETEILFVGQGSREVRDASLPQGVLRLEEQRPYFEALGSLRSASVLLIVVPPEGGAGNHTGKLFPYLASGRPILLQAPKSNVAAELVRRSRSGIVIPPDDVDGVANALKTLYADWKRGVGLPDQDRELVARYEANPQAVQLGTLLDRLARTARTKAL
jgi:glycosyltransferase involved in cell wall biosynthesis